MKHFIDTQVTTGGYSSVSEDICALVRDAQQRQAKTRLEALLLEVLDNGDITALPPEDWDAIRREGLAHFRAHSAGKSDNPLSKA